jgi:cardiolipin synthase
MRGLPLNKNRYSSGHRLELLKSGRFYFDTLIDFLNAARQEIHFQSYIFKPDETGQRIIASLREAAGRGVKVCLLLDAFGSSSMKGAPTRALEKAGVEVRFFGNLFSNGRIHFGRRLHHKVITVDGIKAIVGGINISNDYNDSTNQPPWLDFAVFMSGRAARKLHLICRQIWNRVRLPAIVKSSRKIILSAVPVTTDESLTAVAQNDYLRGKKEIATTYRQSIRSSETSIDLIGAYFLPGRLMRKSIRSARERGVKVRLILAGKSDVKLAALAREYLYSWLLRQGVEIYEFQPGNVHGKVLLIDNQFTSLGSFDLNNLSTYSNIELNINITSKAFCHLIKSEFNQIIEKQCKLIGSDGHHRRFSPWRKLACWTAYRITKSLFVLSWIVAGTALANRKK